MSKSIHRFQRGLVLVESKLEEHGYIKVVAKQIKGFPREIVIVDKDEFDGLSAEIKQQYFDLLE
jgi:hypothetical protein